MFSTNDFQRTERLTGTRPENPNLSDGKVTEKKQTNLDNCKGPTIEEVEIQTLNTSFSF